MKYLFVLLSVLIAMTSAQSDTGFYDGPPMRKCPPGEHSVLYCPQKAEPSCDNPTIHDLPAGRIGPCDVPQCFCNSPNLRNTKTGKCVKPSDC